MVMVKDLMIRNPFYLNVNDTIQIAKNVFGNSQYRSIPVVYSDNKYAGIINEKTVLQKNALDFQKNSEFLELDLPILKEDDSLSVITEINLNDSSFLLPVIDQFGYLIGILPKPKFLRDVFQDISSGLKNLYEIQTIDISSSGIIIVDDDGKIICFNANAENVVGYNARDIFGIHINKVIHDSRLTEVAKKGVAQFKQKVYTDNKAALCTNRVPLFINGNNAGAMGVFKNITQNEELREKIRGLREFNKRLVSIFESINDGIIVVDSEGIIIRVNTAFERITGRSANCWIRENVKQVFEKYELPNLFHEELFEKKKTINFIEYINNAEYLVVWKPIYSDSFRVPHYVGTIKDIGKVNEIVTSIQVTQEVAERFYSEFEKSLNERIKQQEMIVHSSSMKRVMTLAVRVAQVDTTVLITGETGVGKEVLARAIHKCSRRIEGPFIKLNCGAIPEALLESELFGYEPGAFTGAKREGKPGLIEMAEGGTLFLDEIGELPINIQVKFLSVLQEREVQRVGGVKVKKVDFRLIAATNRNLEEMVKQKQFREDLFYRLNVVPVLVPPLRNRREDIVPLIIHFLNKFNKKYGMNKKIAPEVIQSLIKYDWPGNIRDLENTIERLMVTNEKNLITESSLVENTKISVQGSHSVMDLREVLEQTEKNIISQASQDYNTTREMAEVLGISQSAVVKKMQKYGIKNLG